MTNGIYSQPPRRGVLGKVVLGLFLLFMGGGGGWCGSDLFSREAVRQALARVEVADSIAGHWKVQYDSVMPLVVAAVDSAIATDPPAPLADTVYRPVRVLVERVREVADPTLLPVVDSLAEAVDSLESHIEEKEREWAEDRAELTSTLLFARQGLTTADNRILSLEGALQAEQDLVEAIRRENRFALRWNRNAKVVTLSVVAGVVLGLAIK